MIANQWVTQESPTGTECGECAPGTGPDQLGPSSTGCQHGAGRSPSKNDVGAISDRPLKFEWSVSADVLARAGWQGGRPQPVIAALAAVLGEAALAGAEERWVSYSRRRAFYVGQQRYRGRAFTYALVTRAVQEAGERGWIDEERASPGQRGWQSRFRARPALLSLIGDEPVEFRLHGLIRLKDNHGRLMPFRDTDRTRQMEQSVAELNEFVKAIELHLEGPDVRRTVNHLIVGGAYFRPTPPGLYRVFNRGSFSLGGRSYGWWQALPKAHRQALLINGEPAVEPDFRQMHPAILYALRGLRLDHDPYETGIFSRQEGKLAFNVALNAASLQGAIAALSNKKDWALSREETRALSTSSSDATQRSLTPSMQIRVCD